jgi:hypothetical protein
LLFLLWCAPLPPPPPQPVCAPPLLPGFHSCNLAPFVSLLLPLCCCYPRLCVPRPCRRRCPPLVLATWPYPHFISLLPPSVAAAIVLLLLLTSCCYRCCRRAAAADVVLLPPLCCCCRRAVAVVVAAILLPPQLGVPRPCHCCCPASVLATWPHSCFVSLVVCLCQIHS